MVCLASRGGIKRRISEPMGNLTPPTRNVPFTGHSVSSDGVSNDIEIPAITFTSDRRVIFDIRTTATLGNLFRFYKNGGSYEGFALRLSFSNIQLWDGSSWFTIASSSVINDGYWHKVNLLLSGTSYTFLVDGDPVASGSCAAILNHTNTNRISDELNSVEGEYADFRVYDGATLIRHYEFNNYDAGSINGLPAFCSVSDQHGVCNGCSAVVGIGPQDGTEHVGNTAEFDDAYWLNGTNQWIDTPLTFSAVTVNSIEVDFIVKDTYTASSSMVAIFQMRELGVAVGTLNLGPATGLLTDEVVTWNGGGSDRLGFDADLAPGKHTVSIVWNGSAYEMKLDGVASNLSSGTNSTQRTFDEIHIGRDFGTGYLPGGVTRLEINGVDWSLRAGNLDSRLALSGSPFTIGDLRRTPPQSALYDWNRRMWFGGVSHISFTAGGTTSGYFGACTISSKVWVHNPATTQILHAHGGSNYRVWLNTTWRLNSSTDTGVAATEGEHDIATTYDASGNAISFSVDGSVVWTGLAPFGNATTGNNFFVGARSSALEWQGAIWDFSLSGSAVKNFSFRGNGIRDEDWRDTTGGGNHATVNGSPLEFILSESSTTRGEDILGSVIEFPRVGRFNFTGWVNDLVKIPYNGQEISTQGTILFFADAFQPALTVTENRHFLDKYGQGGNDRCWRIYRSTNTPSGHIIIQVADAGGTFYTITFDIPAGYEDKNMNCAFRWDGTSTGSLDVWADGEGWSSCSVASGSFPTSALRQAKSEIAIGGRPISGGENFRQPISPPSVFTRVLSNAEIENLRLKNHYDYGRAAA